MSIPVCVVNREPRPLDSSAPWAGDLSVLVEEGIGVYEGRAPQGMRVLFAASTRQMDQMPFDDSDPHFHITIEADQALAMYPGN